MTALTSKNSMNYTLCAQNQQDLQTKEGKLDKNYAQKQLLPLNETYLLEFPINAYVTFNDFTHPKIHKDANTYDFLPTSATPSLL